MLLIIVLQSLVFTGIITLAGNLYLSSFNTILTDCYEINQLLAAYEGEAGAFAALILHRDETAYDAFRDSRAQSNAALSGLSLPFLESPEQAALLSAIRRTHEGFRAAQDDAVSRALLSGDYASAYERALEIGRYLEGYIKSLLQAAIGEGQSAYGRNIVRFRVLPIGFLLSVALSVLCTSLWTRWTVRHVVSPINDIIKAADAIADTHYDTPDLPSYAEEELNQLATIVNQMKHSTAKLLDSLSAQRAIESRLHEEELRRVTMESTMDTLRLSLLQSQINPHFLFNTLNIISRMAQMEGAPTTEELIKRLASLFRYNLQSTDDMVPLSNELKIVHDYIAIQRIRFGERIQFHVCCGPDPAGVRVPVFTLQPLIENAVIHGIGPIEEGGEVLVDIQRGPEGLIIAVSDTGVGMTDEQLALLLDSPPAERRHLSGLGLGNVRARIHAHYPGSTFKIDSRLGEGTRITIIIPG